MKIQRQNNKAIFTIVIFTFLFSLAFNLNIFAQNENKKTYTASKSINKDDATFVNVQVSFLGGKIDISGGSKQLINAKFEYSEKEWKPEIEYNVKNKIGNLKIWMPDVGDDISINDDDVNNWDIRLNNATPMDLNIKLGGGEGNYDLSQLKMNSLEIRLGGGKLDIDLKNSSLPRLDFKAVAGEATVDLRGDWNNALEADFVCGFGELNLKLPQKVGVKVKATGILGSIDAPGFSKEGSNYTNDAYGTTKATLYIDIFGGIGNVHLKMET